jgi:chitodextrinase
MSPARDALRSPAVRSWPSLLLAITLLAGVALFATTAVAATQTVFEDGFESGSLSAWTSSRGVVVQTDLVASGTYAARAATRSVPGFAVKNLPAASADVTLGSSIDRLSNGATVSLLRLRTANGAGIVSLKLNKAGNLVRRNEVTGTTLRSSVGLPKNAWHSLSLRAIVNGASSTVEVGFDGGLVSSLSGTTSLGTSPVGSVQIGNSSKATMDVAFDDAQASVPQLSDDQEPPTPPTGLAADPLARSVDLTWAAATDNIGVTSYTVFRNDAPIATVDGATLAFTDHTVRPASSYLYEVAAGDDGGNTSPRSEALGVDTPVADPLITAAGDICPSTPTACAPTATLVETINPDDVLLLGDNQYPDGSLAQYLASYDRTWGGLKGRTMPAPGNHEWQTTNAQGYRSYFGSAFQTNGGLWYSYDLGAWHLVSLDSDCAKIGGCDVGAPEYTWLEQDLGADTRACTLAYWHHPLFTSGASNVGTGAVKPLWDLLLSDDAEMILNGHVHNYERFAPQTSDGVASDTGIREFIVGTGGNPNMDGFGTLRPNSESQITGSPGVLELTLSASSYAWAFVDTSGAILDQGTEDCH